MKNKQINYFKILSIVFMLAIIVLSSILYIQQSSYYEIAGVKIKQSTINDFSSVMNNQPFRLCDTIQNKCITIARIR